MKPSSVTRRGLSHAKANVVFHQRQPIWLSLSPFSTSRGVVSSLGANWFSLFRICVCGWRGRSGSFIVYVHLKTDARRQLIKHLLIDHKKKQQRYIVKLKHSFFFLFTLPCCYSPANKKKLRNINLDTKYNSDFFNNAVFSTTLSWLSITTMITTIHTSYLSYFLH